MLKFLHIMYESFDLDLTQEFFLFMVALKLCSSFNDDRNFFPSWKRSYPFIETMNQNIPVLNHSQSFHN